MPQPLEVWALHPYPFDIGVPPPKWVRQYRDAPKFGIKTKQENMSTVIRANYFCLTSKIANL